MYIIHIIAVNVALDLEAVGQLLTQGSLSMSTYKKCMQLLFKYYIYVYLYILDKLDHCIPPD